MVAKNSFETRDNNNLFICISPFFKQTNSEKLNANFFKSNIHNINVIFGKNQAKKKVSGSIIDRKKKEEIRNIFHNKNSEDKEKEIVKINIIKISISTINKKKMKMKKLLHQKIKIQIKKKQ